MGKEVTFKVATTSCKNVETLSRKNTLSCFKSLPFKGLWDIILTSLLPPIQICSSKFWAWSCIVNDIWNKSYMNCGNGMKMKKWSSQWTQFMQLRKKAWKKKSGLQWVLNPWPRDTGAMLYQLSYEATDVRSRSIVGSYVPVKEMSVNDIWNKSCMNYGNGMKMKKWSSQWN